VTSTGLRLKKKGPDPRDGTGPGFVI